MQKRRLIRHHSFVDERLKKTHAYLECLVRLAAPQGLSRLGFEESGKGGLGRRRQRDAAQPHAPQSVSHFGHGIEFGVVRGGGPERFQRGPQSTAQAHSVQGFGPQGQHLPARCRVPEQRHVPTRQQLDIVCAAEANRLFPPVLGRIAELVGATGQWIDQPARHAYPVALGQLLAGPEDRGRDVVVLGIGALRCGRRRGLAWRCGGRGGGGDLRNGNPARARCLAHDQSRSLSLIEAVVPGHELAQVGDQPAQTILSSEELIGVRVVVQRPEAFLKLVQISNLRIEFQKRLDEFGLPGGAGVSLPEPGKKPVPSGILVRCGSLGVHDETCSHNQSQRRA